MFFVYSCNCAQSFGVHSPNKKLYMSVYTQQNNIRWSATYMEKTIIYPSKLGILSPDLELVGPYDLELVSKNTGKDSYDFYGGHYHAEHEYCETIIKVFNYKHAELYNIEMRAYDDGVAYRYSFEDHDSEPVTIRGELSSWKPIKDGRYFYQTHLDCYEGVYHQKEDFQLVESKVYALPIVIEYPERGFMMLTESNLGTYSDLATVYSKIDGFSAFLHADHLGFEQNRPFKTPWRVTIYVETLNDLVNTDLIRNLANPGEIQSWIQPGRSTWQWLSSGSPVYKDQKKWVDMTAKLGFEYYLIDDGWINWDDEDPWSLLFGIIKYAKSKGVKVFVWANMKDVNDNFVQILAQNGATGLKADFFPPANSSISRFYEHLEYTAYKNHLLLDLHGAVKPTGQERTWPHELSREGVRGHEHHSDQIPTSVTPSTHDTILPFTRYVQGNGDYTPGLLSSVNNTHYSCSREIGSGIIFTSPYLCWGGDPADYLKSEALPIIKAIPSVYNETRVLNGSKIGEAAIFARRLRKNWFIGGVNGPKPLETKVVLDFLGNEEYEMMELVDESMECKLIKRKVTKGNEIIIKMNKDGGYAATIIPVNGDDSL